VSESPKDFESERKQVVAPLPTLHQMISALKKLNDDCTVETAKILGVIQMKAGV